MHPIKLFILLIFGFIALYFLIDNTVCNGMSYHDYAAGIDRRFSCPWQK